ncbi:MAG: hypothetical protein ACR2NN_20620 [Bryobacteraceae bacterium]
MERASAHFAGVCHGLLASCLGFGSNGTETRLKLRHPIAGSNSTSPAENIVKTVSLSASWTSMPPALTRGPMTYGSN